MNQADKPKVSIIVAVAGEKAVIGKNNDLAVRISDDMKRFRALTQGHSIIMGRKTYESIDRPLLGRPNFVVTRNSDFTATGVTVCSNLEDAITQAWQTELQSSNSSKEIFLIGGSEIYRQGLPFTNRIYLTKIEGDFDGDTFFPEYAQFTKVIKREDRTDEKTGLKYSWIDLER